MGKVARVQRVSREIQEAFVLMPGGYSNQPLTLYRGTKGHE
jgi:hypothetical protein